MPNAKLMPCPFCGSLPAGIIDGKKEGVWCGKNTASMPHAGKYHAEINHWCGLIYIYVGAHRSTKKDAVSAVIEAWNKRVVQPSLDAILEVS